MISQVVFLTEDAKVARAGTYAVKLDPQFWYDQVRGAPECLRLLLAASESFGLLPIAAAFLAGSPTSPVKPSLRLLSATE